MTLNELQCSHYFIWLAKFEHQQRNGGMQICHVHILNAKDNAWRCT